MLSIEGMRPDWTGKNLLRTELPETKEPENVVTEPVHSETVTEVSEPSEPASDEAVTVEPVTEEVTEETETAVTVDEPTETEYDE